MTKQLIKSKEYLNLDWDDWDSRHNDKIRRKFGVWRWKGIHDNRKLIFSMIKGTVLDFGGALGPLGFMTHVIDQQVGMVEDSPVLGLYDSMCEFKDGTATLVFSSHCLEHIHFMKEILTGLAKKLIVGGKLVLHVPSIKGREYWHPAVKPEHLRLFAIGNDVIQDVGTEIYIDMVVHNIPGMAVTMAKHVGDCSILLIAERYKD